MGKEKFSEEFKKETVALYQSSNKTQKQISEELGVSLATLARWLSTYGKAQNTINTTKKVVNIELIQLKKELERIKKENEILKKAAAFFARESL